MSELPVAIWRCCRDWPVVMPNVVGMGRCGYCGETPEPTDKTVEQYMAEREEKQ
ncbi:MAG TPA: hypothetical protein VFM86_09710 [Pedococcus sp.]|nr:hypothetical protein [Pedococcus sp.]